jgi:hypothetical protein
MDKRAAGTVTGSSVVVQTLTIARFRNRYDTVVRQHDATWPELGEILTRHTVRRNKDGPLWSPTLYRPDTTRGNKQVESLGLLVLDFDEGLTPEEVTPLCERWAYVIYSTHSHTPEKSKWRIVFPLARTIRGADWLPVWLRAAHYFSSSTADPQCKEPARMYYLPSHPPGGEAFALTHEGAWLDPDDLPALPPEVARPPRANANGKGIGLGKGDYRTLDIESLFRSRGHYGRPMGGGKHAVLCPWFMEHTDPYARDAEDSDTVVWEASANQWPSFDCKHAHCEGRKIADVIRLWDADRFCAREFVVEEKPPMPGEKDIPPGPPAELTEPDSAERVHIATRKENAARRKLEALQNGAEPHQEGDIFPEIYTASYLETAEFPEPKWIIPGILCEGLCLLVGPPKGAKSALALGTAIATASGGYALAKFPVEQGAVLYLALEDIKRRMQDRMRKMLKGARAPADLHFAHRWPKAGEQGGDVLIARWIEAHPNTRLVIIDTMEKFRDRRKSQGNAYSEDYSFMEVLQRLAHHYGICLLMLHHTNKRPDPVDPFHAISGTEGIGGSADTTLLLRRSRGEREGKLFVTSRDVEENEYRIDFDGETMTWAYRGKAGEGPKTTDQAALLKIVASFRVPVNPRDVHTKMAEMGSRRSQSAVKAMMWRLFQDGELILHDKGAYGLPERH